MFDSISSCTVWIVDLLSSHLCFSVLVSGTNKSVCTLAMLDSGATAVFINERFVLQHNILRYPLIRPIALHNINGSINKVGSLTDFACLTMNIGSKYTEKLDFLITDLGPENIILWTAWNLTHSPTIPRLKRSVQTVPHIALELKLASSVKPLMNYGAVLGLRSLLNLPLKLTKLRPRKHLSTWFLRNITSIPKCFQR
jgi:hypothetical protein